MMEAKAEVLYELSWSLHSSMRCRGLLRTGTLRSLPSPGTRARYPIPPRSPLSSGR